VVSAPIIRGSGRQAAKVMVMLERANAAILFPGQGAATTASRPLVESQCAGLYRRARSLLGADPFERADDSTRYAQPAIYLASLAGWRACAQTGLTPYAFAGHSLGEIAALAAAGALAPEEGLELVVMRARLMEEASACAPGGMIAILKGTVEQAEEIALHNHVHVANYNAPGQTVLSGDLDGLDGAAREAREQGLRTLRLNVSGAFHSPALSSVRQRFGEALSAAGFVRPSAPVLSSMTASPFVSPATELAAALTKPVRWSETMLALERLGAGAYLDVGPDRVLQRLAPRNLSDPELIDREALCVLA
jgi:[acyl-carrier-protein] S-malonyltransferase